jgi:hypothetical protein
MTTSCLIEPEPSPDECFADDWTLLAPLEAISSTISKVASQTASSIILGAALILAFRLSNPFISTFSLIPHF